MPLGVILGSVALAACGGESTRTDERSGSYSVDVTRASFPARQHVAAASDLVLAITNTGDETIPELAVTVTTAAGSAGGAKAQGAFASATGPVWLPASGYPKFLAGGETPAHLDAGPSAGADAAPTNTYVFGELAAGQSRTVVWRVIPVRAGAYTIQYAIAAGTLGGAKAVTASGAPATGRFRVRIDPNPRGACVATSSGLRSESCA
jgi:hypothetical protein